VPVHNIKLKMTQNNKAVSEDHNEARRIRYQQKNCSVNAKQQLK
jgi:hypothetical protein